MSLLISTNVFDKVEDWAKIHDLIKAVKYDDKGIEIFPLWDQEGFEELLEKNEEYLKGMKITFHGAYYGVEPSAPKNTKEYYKSIAQNKKTIDWCNRLNGKFVVHHHNNRKIPTEEREQIIKNSDVQLKELTDYASKNSVALFIENVGVNSNGNNLWTDDEFIEMSLSIPNPILIDVGHANANKWDIEKIIVALKDKIIAYHLHNNYGIYDSHNRIREGSFDFEKFIRLYKLFTPDKDLTLEYSDRYKDEIDYIAQDAEWLIDNLNRCDRSAAILY